MGNKTIEFKIMGEIDNCKNVDKSSKTWKKAKDMVTILKNDT